MKEFNTVVKGSISDEDLSRAKPVFVHEVVELTSLCSVYCRNQLKTRYLVGIDTQASLAEDIAAQVLGGGGGGGMLAPVFVGILVFVSNHMAGALATGLEI